MARPKNMKRVFPVPTAAIKREILEAARKLKALEKKKLRPPERKAIKLELALLKDCFYKLGNISPF